MHLHWKRKVLALAVVLGLHIAWLQSLQTHISSRTKTTLTIDLATATFTMVLHGSDSSAQAMRGVSAEIEAKNVTRKLRQIEYLDSVYLDTRAAPSRLVWNIDKQLIRCSKPTSLVFTVWVSSTGTIDALEPHTCNGEQWIYDGLAETLQTTSMVPASIRTQPVASTMTVELVVDDDE